MILFLQLELKETGHTPEHDGKAAPQKMEVPASRSSSEEQEEGEAAMAPQAPPPQAPPPPAVSCCSFRFFLHLF